MKTGKHAALTEEIIGLFYLAYNELGYGYNENVYSAALDVLFREAGLNARREHCVDVLFRGQRIANYRLDYLIEEKVILELKAGAALAAGAKSQLLTYLRSSRKEVGLLLYFGPKPEVSRAVL